MQPYFIESNDMQAQTEQAKQRQRKIIIKRQREMCMGKWHAFAFSAYIEMNL